jgi:hypothetical protein
MIWTALEGLKPTIFANSSLVSVYGRRVPQLLPCPAAAVAVVFDQYGVAFEIPVDEPGQVHTPSSSGSPSIWLKSQS